jgi:polyhydroxybutyrate depolymerase
MALTISEEMSLKKLVAPRPWTLPSTRDRSRRRCGSETGRSRTEVYNRASTEKAPAPGGRCYPQTVFAATNDVPFPAYNLTMRRLAGVVLVLAVLVPGSAAGDAGSGTEGRPYGFKVPPSYDATRPTPLVVLLHGYTSNGPTQANYFGLPDLAEKENFLLAYPDGTRDRMGNRFWNATDACCDFFGSGVDDVAYLDAVVDEVQQRYNVDRRRIYLVGHSNGAFMAHRYACDRPGLVAGIVTLAGMQWKDPARCGAGPAEAVSVLHVHGTEDALIDYEGGATPQGAYPGAVETVATWAAKSGCGGPLAGVEGRLDLDSGVAGEETSVARHEGCSDAAAELWTIEGGSHVPAFNTNWAGAIYGFLAGHPKAG